MLQRLPQCFMLQVVKGSTQAQDFQRKFTELFDPASRSGTLSSGRQRISPGACT
jgi:hypothetical protein